MSATIKKLENNLNIEIDDKTNAIKKVGTLMEEREKMRHRIIKLKQRRGKVDQGFKTCKNCAKEYHEADNFNWSCRTHRNAYQEDVNLWWCCGK